MNNHQQKLIYLVGFMGAGKSSVGTVLAQRMGWPFVDLDTVIEAGQGATIRQIFEHAGEPFFRQVEHAALVEVAKKAPAVIALGGGTFVQRPNFDLIRQTRGATIWLDCPIEELWQRCSAMDNRPLFRDRESFSKLFEQRLPYYRQSEFRIATGGRSSEEIAQEILRLGLF
ncbi:MAG: shikimate kinase [Acidobacteria bacterium]|nr:MAG: shikimate kinase [Acidobacteriota bacterium]